MLISSIVMIIVSGMSFVVFMGVGGGCWKSFVYIC